MTAYRDDLKRLPNNYLNTYSIGVDC